MSASYTLIVARRALTAGVFTAALSNRAPKGGCHQL